MQQVEQWGLWLTANGDRHTETGDRVGFWKRFGELVAVSFGHTTSDDQLRVVTAVIVQCQDRVNRFFSCFFDKGTRVDHDQIGLICGLGRRHAIGNQGAFQLVAINLILGTAKCLNEIQATLPSHRGTSHTCRVSHRARLAPRHRHTLVLLALLCSRLLC